LQNVRLEPHSESEALAVAKDMCARLPSQRRLSVDDGAVPVALDLARQYVSDEKLPGNLLDLLKRTANRCITDRKTRMTAEDVTLTLSQVTGLPISILDTKERLDLTAIRQFFGARVIGQDEAVGAVVDRIAMLKAGLVDSGKPIGVFLFAGPTGTGKTELAKTLAEYLFGSADRLIRLDMSEFQTPESTIKILGESNDRPDTDSLINRVRKQPFSVVLLDEFEKAHARVWDLFLQVFDDARLSDASGRVADFRHTIIILTSNLGATAHRGSGLGFAPAAEEFSPDQINIAIAQTFRPEFQNRLDKVIVFKPLTRELMRGILRKELSQVLERRGLKDRDWAVEWEASAQDFLLEKGFSPEMGARPLKRAIDQYVLAPLAATIVERRFPEGDQFVFVRSDGHGIQAEFVDPDADARPKASSDGNGARPNLGAMILDPMGTPVEREALDAAAGEIERTIGSEQWDQIKLRLAEEMSKPDFWSRPERHTTLARLALMDRVQAAANTAASLRGRLARGGTAKAQYSRELIQRLALQLHVVKLGLQDALEGAPIEVALLIEPALDASGEAAATRKWCAQLGGMYRGWAEARNMQLSELSNLADKSLPILAISGFGAHRLLLPEVGLHVLEQGEDGGRATARVRLVVAPLGDLPQARYESLIRDSFAKSAPSNAVVRRYRGGAAPLVRDASGAWRTGKFDQVMRGDFDLIGAAQ
jgi:ATP-dependent Clp protease ATP-binding subunit ClpC